MLCWGPKRSQLIDLRGYVWVDNRVDSFVSTQKMECYFFPNLVLECLFLTIHQAPEQSNQPLVVNCPGALGQRGPACDLPASFSRRSPDVLHILTQLVWGILTLGSKEASVLFIAHILLPPNWVSSNVFCRQKGSLKYDGWVDGWTMNKFQEEKQTQDR